ncbi:hypothetical protein [Endozoicomonas sp. ALC066]|uniref:hypothetical protein n=1 Tax=Endozoicomonas sp. ALC066 TaxID=3403078 RepID=UPI003BB5ED59
MLNKPSLTDGESLLAEYFFHRRLRGLEPTDPAGLRADALRANKWLDLLQKNPPLLPGPGWERPAFTLDTGLGRYQAQVQTKDGQKTFTLGRRDDLAFSNRGPGYTLTHSEGDRKQVFRLQLPDRWPDRLLPIRLVVHMEFYRKLQREGQYWQRAITERHSIHCPGDGGASSIAASSGAGATRQGCRHCRY